MKKLIMLIPLILLLVTTSFVLIYLLSGKNPNQPPSALLDKDIPSFKSISLFDNQKILEDDILTDKVVIINFFASWCLPCKVEHPLFFDLKNDNPEVFLLGINHKDQEDDAKRYLLEDGDPYDFVAVDPVGNIALEFGVFGLPETYVINKDGKIILKFMGPLTKEIIKNEIEPFI